MSVCEIQDFEALLADLVAADNGDSKIFLSAPMNRIFRALDTLSICQAWWRSLSSDDDRSLSFVKTKSAGPRCTVRFDGDE